MGLIKDLMKKTAMGGGSTSNAGASGCCAGASSLTLDAQRLDAMNPGERLAALRKELIVHVKEAYPDAMASMVRGRQRIRRLRTVKRHFFIILFRALKCVLSFV